MENMNLLIIDDDNNLEISDVAFQYFNINKVENNNIITIFDEVDNKDENFNNYLKKESDIIYWIINKSFNKEIWNKIFNLAFFISSKIIIKNSNISEFNIKNKEFSKNIIPNIYSNNKINIDFPYQEIIDDDINNLDNFKDNKYKNLNKSFLIGYIMEICDYINDNEEINILEIFKSNLYSFKTTRIENELCIVLKELENKFDNKVLSFKDIINNLFKYINICFNKLNDIINPKNNFIKESIERILISFKESIVYLYNENKENSSIKYFELRDDYYNILDKLNISEGERSLNIDEYFKNYENSIFKILKLFKQIKGKEKYKKMFREFPLKILENQKNNILKYIWNVQEDYFSLKTNYTSLKDIKLNLEVEALKKEKCYQLNNSEDCKIKLDKKNKKISNLKQYIKKLEEDNKSNIKEYMKKSQLLQDINKKYYENELEIVNLKRLFSESKDINVNKIINKNDFNQNLNLFKNNIISFKNEFNTNKTQIEEINIVFNKLKIEFKNYILELKSDFSNELNNSSVRNKGKDDFIQELIKELESNKVKLKYSLKEMERLQNIVWDLKLTRIKEEKLKIKNQETYENIIKKLKDTITKNKLTISKVDYINDERIKQYKGIIEESNNFKFILSLITNKFWKEKDKDKKTEYINDYKKYYILINKGNRNIIEKVISKYNINNKYIN